MSAQATEHRFVATQSSGEVSALLVRPEAARALYVFGHGAGAGMRHVFMETVAGKLSDLGVATFRYNFPFVEAGRRGPNHPPILVKTVRSAVTEAASLAPDLPLLAGGKSMGGRMTSTAASKDALPGVLGLAFFGFPLHAPGKDSDERGAHLADVGLPMLFLQGTRDRLARLDFLEPRGRRCMLWIVPTTAFTSPRSPAGRTTRHWTRFAPNFPNGSRKRLRAAERTGTAPSAVAPRVNSRNPRARVLREAERSPLPPHPRL